MALVRMLYDIYRRRVSIGTAATLPEPNRLIHFRVRLTTAELAKLGTDQRERFARACTRRPRTPTRREMHAA